MKRCTKCGLPKSLKCFSKDKHKPDGYSSRCKECAGNYYLENRQKILDQMKEHFSDPAVRLSKKRYGQIYRALHREELYRRNAEYRKEHRQEAREYSREWRENHPDASKRFREENPDYQSEWRQKNLESVRRNDRRNSRQRRAHKRNVDEDFTSDMERFVREFWSYKCAICGRLSTLFENKFPIDHWLPLTPANRGLGYPLAIGNAVLLCLKHNSMKLNKLAREVFSEDIVRSIDLRLQEQIELWNEKQDN